MEDYNPFYTHRKVLTHAVKNSKGAVLEIGCGHGSTQILHDLCKGRRLVTLETDKEWLAEFDHLATDEHEIYSAESYEAFDKLIRSERWDVVFIDHAPGERRNDEIMKVLNAMFVVVHDTHDPAYEYEKTFPNFAYQYQYTKEIPYTSVLSNINDLSTFDEL
jgi:predicted O-methyltransferase YrrM